jgi:hypothetical protein
MAITANSARAYYGLQANAEPTSEGTTGTLSIGQGQTVTTLASATEAIVLGIELDTGHDVEIDLEAITATITGAGVNQVETATAVGTITASGNATVVVTGDDITGSPLTVSVAVLNTDTASAWAQKVRTALGAVSAITSVYTVGGSTTAITLTRTVARYNDSTLNISLANGTCTGITAAPTSVGTTAGVNPAKCYRISGTSYSGDNFEGANFAAAQNVYGFCAKGTAGPGRAAIVSSDGFEDIIHNGEIVQKLTSDPEDGLDTMQTGGGTLTLTGSSGYSKTLVTLFFST